MYLQACLRKFTLPIKKKEKKKKENRKSIRRVASLNVYSYSYSHYIRKKNPKAAASKVIAVFEI